MSFAAGLVAGQRAAQGAIDAFTQARENRNRRRANEEIAQLEQGLIQNDIQASQGFVGPMPTEAAETQRAQGLGIPQTPASQQAMLRADIYRKHGLMDDQDAAFQRGVTLSELERQQRQDAEATRQFDVEARRLQQTADAAIGVDQAKAGHIEAATTAQERTNRINRGYDALNESWAAAGGDREAFVETDAYKYAHVDVQNRWLDAVTQTTASQRSLAEDAIIQRMEAAGDLQGMAEVWSEDELFSPGYHYNVVTDGDNVKIMLNRDGGAEKPRMLFEGNYNQGVNWMKQQVQGKEKAALYMEDLNERMRKVEAEIANEGLKRDNERARNIAGAVDAIETQLGNFAFDNDGAVKPGWEFYSKAAPAQRFKLIQMMLYGGLPDRDEGQGALR